VHSVLHLLGYDHLEDEDKREMREVEKDIMGD
jgi:probable rRNA maturation factor